MGNYTRNDLTYYKFVMYQVKRMVTDPHGDPIYIKAFDHVMYDLYGIEDFSLRMSRMYKNTAIMKLIDKVGISQLMKLFKNPSYCNILYEMTMISEDLRVLKKKIVKKRAKGDTKCIRSDQKTFNDLLKLYNKGIKALRKSLKIKDISKAYKDKYKFVRSFVGQSGRNDLYWDDINFDGFDEILDEDDDIFGDDFDDDDSAIFEDFQRDLLGGSKKRRTRKRQTRKAFEFDDDEEDDEYEDASLDELTDTVNNLCNHMQSLSDTVQGLAAEKHYDTVNNRTKRNTRVTHSNRTVQVPQTDQLSSDIADMKNTMKSVVDVLQDMNGRISNVEELIDEVEDDDEYTGGSGYVNQYVQDRLNTQQQQQIRPGRGDTAAIIDALNNANDMTPEMLARISEES